MQQKSFKYLLLAGAALIWGTVLYRVLSGLPTDEKPVKAGISNSMLTAKDTATYEPYSLLSNYEDPFGAAESKDELTVATDSLINATLAFLKNSPANYTDTKPDIPFIQLKGIITNSSTHKRAAIININGKDEFVKPGVKLNDLTINTVLKNKIQITYQGEKYWIKKQ